MKKKRKSCSKQSTGFSAPQSSLPRPIPFGFSVLCTQTTNNCNSKETAGTETNYSDRVSNNEDKVLDSPHAARNKVEDGNLISQFLAWLTKLRYDELKNALCISIKAQNGLGVSSSLTAKHASNGSFRCDQKGNGHDSDDSARLLLSEQDYRLLRDMISLLPCPPIPIHPKATGQFKTASSVGADDGRDPEIMKRNYQVNRPRLFQFIERQSIETDVSSTARPTNTKSHSQHHHRKRNGDIAKNTRNQDSPSTSTSSCKSNVEVWTGSSSRKSLDVIARKFVLSDGERLSLGCCREQQDADLALLHGTVFKYCTGSISTPSYIAFEPNIECDVTTDNSHIDVTGDLRNLLKIVSRGNFGKFLPNEMLLSSHMNETENKNKTNRDTSCTGKIRMQWFDPEARWFSLPMYIAHCFELALWHAFFNQTKDHRKSTLNILVRNIPCPDEAPNSPINSLSNDLILLKAIHQATLGILHETQKLISEKYYIRDSLAWKVITSDSCLTQPTGTCDQFENLAAKLWICPLLEIQSKTEQWRCYVRKIFVELNQKAFQEAMVQDLLRQLENEEGSNRNNDSDETHRVVNKKIGLSIEGEKRKHAGWVFNRSINRNKKSPSQSSKEQGQPTRIKRQSYSEHSGTALQQSSLTTSISQDVNDTLPAIDSSNGSAEDDDDVFFQTLVVRSDTEEKKVVRFEYPKNIKSARDRNRNIVIALSILDDVMDSVFETVQQISGSPLSAFADTDNKSQHKHEEGQLSFQVIDNKAKKALQNASSLNLRSKLPHAVSPVQVLVKNVGQASSTNLYGRNCAEVRSGHELNLSATNAIKVDKSAGGIQAFESGIESNLQKTILPHPDRCQFTPFSGDITNLSNVDNLPLSVATIDHQQRFEKTGSTTVEFDGTKEWHGLNQELHAQQGFTAEDSCATVKRANLDYSSQSNIAGTIPISNPWDYRSFFVQENFKNIVNPCLEEKIQGELPKTRKQEQLDKLKQGEIVVPSAETSIISTDRIKTNSGAGDGFTFDVHTEVIEAAMLHADDGTVNEKDQHEWSFQDEISNYTTIENEISNTHNLYGEKIFPTVPLSLNTVDSLQCTSFPSYTHATQEGNFESREPVSVKLPRSSPTIVQISGFCNVQKSASEECSYLEHQDVHQISSFGSEPTANVAIASEAPPAKCSIVATLSHENLGSALVESKTHCGSRELAKKARISSTRPIKPAHSGSPKPDCTGFPRTDKSRDDDDVKFRGTSALRRPADAYRHVTTRIDTPRDDQDIKIAISRDSQGRVPSYKGFAVKASCQTYSTLSTINPYPFEASRRVSRNFSPDSMNLMRKDKDFSTRSETALEEQGEYQNLSHRSQANEELLETNTATRDGSTTISSPQSPRDQEEIYILREERNSYRDMCLTLGAEVAKLKNLVAAQKNTSRHHSSEFQSAYGQFPTRTSVIFDPESVSHHAFQIAPRARTLAAMSDAGCGIDQESLVSDDDANRMMNGENLLRQPSTVTMTGSDASIDHISTHNTIHLPFIGIKPTRDIPDPVSLNGMQSRLTKDILQFLESINLQLRKLDSKRQLAVERMSRLVNTLWPRAQVKLYGSHVTGLCLPSSDLDFVVCLPAVHKNTMAIAAGELEVRTAINESSQKLLARRLKGESWIDPRSMKLIERTVVPVIKVSTKDTKARTLQLDITFDAPAHHGLDAVEMVTRIVDEFPMIRPIIIVLKQFLIDRGLLTAYTGGLSSYCLFLMVTRYLQEQPSSWGDCGALLMGFLDFYGNCFDPRTTGISVRNRMYFERPNYAAGRNHGAGQPMWSPVAHPQPRTTVIGISNQSLRRNSFSEKGSVDGIRIGSKSFQSQGAFQSSISTFNNSYIQQQPSNFITPPPDPNASDHRMPYTFDPLFVEDPLSETNNVGRNAFRIFQVQRAFSDAHRALVAALEWDMQSSGELQETNEYPLLKCLLQSEDVVFDL